MKNYLLNSILFHIIFCCLNISAFTLIDFYSEAPGKSYCIYMNDTEVLIERFTQHTMEPDSGITSLLKYGHSGNLIWNKKLVLDSSNFNVGFSTVYPNVLKPDSLYFMVGLVVKQTETMSLWRTSTLVLNEDGSIRHSHIYKNPVTDSQIVVTDDIVMLDNGKIYGFGNSRRDHPTTVFEMNSQGFIEKWNYHIIKKSQSIYGAYHNFLVDYDNEKLVKDVMGEGFYTINKGKYIFDQDSNKYIYKPPVTMSYLDSSLNVLDTVELTELGRYERIENGYKTTYSVPSISYGSDEIGNVLVSAIRRKRYSDSVSNSIEIIKYDMLGNMLDSLIVNDSVYSNSLISSQGINMELLKLTAKQNQIYLVLRKQREIHILIIDFKLRFYKREIISIPNNWIHYQNSNIDNEGNIKIFLSYYEINNTSQKNYALVIVDDFTTTIKSKERTRSRPDQTYEEKDVLGRTIRNDRIKSLNQAPAFNFHKK